MIVEWLGLACGDLKARVPWGKLSGSPEKFFPDAVRAEGVVIRDPHNMSKDGVHFWLSAASSLSGQLGHANTG